MERKEKFIPGERYHVFTRGVEKRTIFEDLHDHDHFVLLLFLSNDKNKVHLGNVRKKYKGEPLIRILTEERTESIVHLETYALMPNHIHLLVKETCEGGISKFMLKLMTAYSMYFNIKYERSGPLFTRPFRSKHIDTDEYFRWAFSYINLNPLELFQADWKKVGVRNLDTARDFMRTYSYSSFQDYFVGDRPQSRLLQKTHEIDESPMLSFDDLVASLGHLSIKGSPRFRNFFNEILGKF